MPAFVRNFYARTRISYLDGYLSTVYSQPVQATTGSEAVITFVPKGGGSHPFSEGEREAGRGAMFYDEL